MTQTLSARTWVTRRMEAMERGGLDDFRELTHPDAVNRESTAEPLACRVPGPEGSYATALWLRSAFSDLRWEVHQAVEDGDLVVSHVTMSGRHTGEYTRHDATGDVVARHPATGRSFAVTQTHWFRLVDGMTAEHWANRDDLGMAVQLGLFG